MKYLKKPSVGGLNGDARTSKFECFFKTAPIGDENAMKIKWTEPRGGFPLMANTITLLSVHKKLHKVLMEPFHFSGKYFPSFTYFKNRNKLTWEKKGNRIVTNQLETCRVIYTWQLRRSNLGSLEEHKKRKKKKVRNIKIWLIEDIIWGWFTSTPQNPQIHLRSFALSILHRLKYNKIEI